MIRSVHDYQIDDVFKKDAGFYYVIPKYQREYTWGTTQWKNLYDDISENDYGYFIGSIICIDNSQDSYQSNPLEIVDGQQRLTTLCLLLTAIYNQLKIYKNDIDEDDLDELTSLRKALICADSENKLILIPQIQNSNRADFEAVMADNELIRQTRKERNWGNRRIARCYKYFIQRLVQDIEDNGSPVATLLEIKKKVSKAVLVKIEVGNHAEAYTLFESLNNRGMPLTAVDLMKNLLLAKAERAGISCDECFDIWQELLAYLTDDYATQERFFRQYYNAFKNSLNDPFRQADNKKKDPLGYIATRSNLLSIYEKLINRDMNVFLEDIIRCGKIYADFILPEETDTSFTKELLDLSRIQGAPSYLLLMYLSRQKDLLDYENRCLKQTIELLTKFFVRRNITDMPNTRDLTRIFMTIISHIEENQITGPSIYQYIESTLVSVSATDELFGEKLKGNIYEENTGATRFILCALAEKAMTDERWSDLWEQNDYNGKKVYKWTIEHIFPEGKNIPDAWVTMIANGDKALAKEYLEQYVHKLGNLTITGYNSALSNYSFIQKRDRTNNEKKPIGYKNGLEINKVLAEKDTWTIHDIQKRTNDLAQDVLELYQF